jgi:hypothetical protein
MNAVGYEASAFADMSRRGFLKAGAAMTTALIGAGAVAGCLGEQSAHDRLAEDAPEVISPRELAVLSAVADRVITPVEGGPTARDARTARRIDRELVFCDGLLTADVRAAISLIEYSPFLDFQFGRFSRLAPAAQDAFLEACAASSWKLRRNAYNGLRFLCLFFYYSDERTWRSIGYGGPMVERKLPEASNARESLDQPMRSARA